MLTQTITLDLLNKIPEESAIIRAGETGRKIKFAVINSDTEDAIDLRDYTCKFQLYKPDGNFIIDTVVASSDGTVTIPFTAQMTAAVGYGRIDLRLTDAEGIIYTCHAVVMFDTPVNNTDLIDSVSMVDGYVFPDDFQLKLTAGDNITIDEDNVISATGGGGGGTGDYNELINKPKINNVILTGNKTTAQLGLPTKTSDLTNDSGFITAAVNNLANYYKKTETYSQAEVNALIGSIASLTLSVVSELPDHDISTSTIYLVPKDVPGTDDVYDEYVYVNSNWEHIGSTTADLTDYYTISQVNTLLAGKVDKETGKGLSTNDFTTAEKNKLAGIQAGAEVNVQADWNQTNVDADDYIKNKPSIGVYTAGDNIQISASNVISATDTTYTAGSGLTLSGTQFRLHSDTEHTLANVGNPAAYDATATYKVGDRCVYNGLWRVCNTDIDTPEDFNSNHWTLDNASDEIDNINQSLAELFQTYETTKTADTNGRIFDTSFSTTNKHIVCVECTTQGSIALPFTLDNETLGVKCLNGSNMSPLSGSLTVKVWYFIKS